MKRLLSIILILMMIGCEVPSKTASKELKASKEAKTVKTEKSEEIVATETVVPETKVEKQTEKSETIVKRPVEPTDLQGNLYFGIRVLDPTKDFKDDESSDDVADRRLTLKFQTSKGNSQLKADWGDENTQQLSKEAKSKTNLDVQINDTFITLLDNGKQFLKLEVSKDFKFMFITEDNSDSTKPELLKKYKVSYVGTGLVLNGEEVTPSNILGANKDRVQPPLPKYPFEN